MNSGDTISRRCFNTALAALMLTLSVVLPVLDRVDVTPEPVAESGHTPAECLQGHDHSICTQVGANHAAATPESGRHHQDMVYRLVSLTSRPAPVQTTLPEGHPSRAPPTV